MPKSLTVTNTIPIAEKWGGPYLIFHRCLPQGKAEGLTRAEGDITTTVWLDKKCVADLHELTDEYINKLSNLTVKQVYAEVVVENVEDRLASFIYDERDYRQEIHHGIDDTDPEFDTLQAAYTDLGLRVYRAAISAVNRLLSFARNEYGQYWLQELPLLTNQLYSMSNRFKSLVRSEDFDWIRWCPPANDSLTIELTDEKRFLTLDDWRKARQFVAGISSPNLILELLSNAELLLEQGRRRSAVIEAASATELALSRFGQSPNLSSIEKISLDRFGLSELGPLIKHLGVTVSINYLLPLLFSEEALPTQTLRQAQDLLTTRHGVVHTGQRDVQHQKAKSLVSAGRRICEILIRSTIEKPKGFSADEK